MECGVVDTYVTYTDPNPGPALYDEYHQALHRQPARIYPPSLSLESVFLRLIATRVSNEEALRLQCSHYNYTVGVKPDPGEVTVVCLFVCLFVCLCVCLCACFFRLFYRYSVIKFCIDQV